MANLAKKILQEFGESFIKAMQMSRKKAKFLMVSAKSANQLVAKQYPAVKLFIPQRLVECLGVASIDADDEDLKYMRSFEKSKMYQTNDAEIVEVRRMKKQGERGQVPLSLVVITFSGSELPSHVELNNTLYPVRKYNYPVRQCRQCWRFGHMVKQCKSKRRCNFCQAEIDNDNHECIGGPTCVNCSGEHRADDRNSCPMFEKKKIEEKKRQNSFSQGKTDWFASLAPNTVPKDIHFPLTATDNRREDVVTKEQEEAVLLKRKKSDNIDFSDDEEFPPLKHRLTHSVEVEAISIGESAASDELYTSALNENNNINTVEAIEQGEFQLDNEEVDEVFSLEGIEAMGDDESRHMVEGKTPNSPRRL